MDDVFINLLFTKNVDEIKYLDGNIVLCCKNGDNYIYVAEEEKWLVQRAGSQD